MVDLSDCELVSCFLEEWGQLVWCKKTAKNVIHINSFNIDGLRINHNIYTIISKSIDSASYADHSIHRVAVLHYVHGMSPRSISESMGISQCEVNRLILKLIKKISKQLLYKMSVMDLRAARQ
jgi:hypothetical protein